MNVVCEFIDVNFDVCDWLLFLVCGLICLYGLEKGCQEVDFDFYFGEVLGIVGEFGLGKLILFLLFFGCCLLDVGMVVYCDDGDCWLDFYVVSEVEWCILLCIEWGFVEQNLCDGLCMGVFVGVNIGEWLMVQGVCYYGWLCQVGLDWLEQVEIDLLCIDDLL